MRSFAVMLVFALIAVFVSTSRDLLDVPMTDSTPSATTNTVIGSN